MTRERTPAVGFIDALGRLDFAALQRSMARNVRFRAIVPPVTAKSPTAKTRRRCFEAGSKVHPKGESFAAKAEVVGDRIAAGYGMAVLDEGKRVVAEQRLICTVKDGRIATVDFLCSGFHPEAPRNRRAADGRSRSDDVPPDRPGEAPIV